MEILNKSSTQSLPNGLKAVAMVANTTSNTMKSFMMQNPVYQAIYSNDCKEPSFDGDSTALGGRPDF
ncbi:hypothetical protein EON64_08465 [archaeon]|nr:MAG: hypothetical protein EON64_08465 [archaeon]